jgi:hypothetical protein
MLTDEDEHIAIKGVHAIRSDLKSVTFIQKSRR